MLKQHETLFINKILRFIFLLILSQNFLFSEPIRNDLKDFFSEAYEFTGPYCEPKCREVSEDNKYMTKLIDFDASTGVSVCEVFPRNSGDNELGKLSVDANTQNLKCTNEFNDIKVNYEDENLNSNKYLKRDGNDQFAKIEGYDKSTITMSRFVAGLATLDDDILNIANSRDGQIDKRNNDSIYNVNSVGHTEPNTLLNTIDTLSTNNLSYYVDFFYNIDEIYEYLVAYVFVFISLFFMIIYTSRIALKKIAKKTTSFEEPWQTKVAIIVFSTVIFFIPMKYDDPKSTTTYSSTLFQNIWKYFVEESSSIADKANTIAMRTYMKKVYNTTGASGVETEANLVLIKTQQEYLKDEYQHTLEYCASRYPRELTFQKTNITQVKYIEDRVGEDAEDKYTLRGCRAIEKRFKLAFTAHDQAQFTLDRIKEAYDDPSNIEERLTNMSTHVNSRVQEIGWYSALLAPTLQVLTKISFLQGKDNLKDVNQEYDAKINAATIEKITALNQEAKNEAKITQLMSTDIKGSEKQPINKTLGEILSKIALTSIVPGANTINKFIDKLSSSDVDTLLTQLQIDKNSTTVNSLSKSVKSLMFSTNLTKIIIENLPFVTTFIAIGIVIIMYLYELIVFSFISPFIVAFAVTTGQARKIMDFLVTALTIFLKPTIIVISIYLSLFLYSIFQDIFMLMANEQFYLSELSTTDFMTSLVFNFVKELLIIFAVFASVFFMWKLIMQMPDFIFKLIGLENLGSTSQMANNMQQSFGKFGFRA